jgi:hypothetical protein
MAGIELAMQEAMASAFTKFRGLLKLDAVSDKLGCLQPARYMRTHEAR